VAVELAVVLQPGRDIDPQIAELRGELLKAVVRSQGDETFV
jgi:hypothetical protein